MIFGPLLPPGCSFPTLLLEDPDTYSLVSNGRSDYVCSGRFVGYTRKYALNMLYVYSFR